MRGPISMMIGMKELVLCKILYYLVEDYSLKYFGENWHNSHRSIVFRIQEIFFFVEWNDFRPFPVERKFLTINRQVNDMCQCWEYIQLDKLDHISINIVQTKQLLKSPTIFSTSSGCAAVRENLHWRPCIRDFSFSRGSEVGSGKFSLIVDIFSIKYSFWASAIFL